MITKNLILSWESYSWVEHCSCMIERSSNKFDIIIVNRDDERPINHCYTNLCYDAIYAQRHYDILTASKLLNLNKVMNLGYYDDQDATKLVTQLQLYIMLHSVKKVYFSYNKILHDILTAIQKSCDFEMLAYGIDKCEPVFRIIKERIELSEEDYSGKLRISQNLHGVPINGLKVLRTEEFYTVKEL